LAANRIRSLQPRRSTFDTEEGAIDILKAQSMERTILKPKRFTEEMVILI
jgi:hypothetical protein